MMITHYTELRTLLTNLINENGIFIPLSHKSEHGFDYFKATNGSLFVTLHLDKDNNIAYSTNINVDLENDCSLTVMDGVLIDPTIEAVSIFFMMKLKVFKKPNVANL